MHQLIERATKRDEARYFQRCKEAIAGGRIVEKDDVAGLLTAQIRAAAQHFFEDVTVAAQLAGGFEITRRSQQYAVAIHVASAGAYKHGAVGVTVKRHA